MCVCVCLVVIFHLIWYQNRLQHVLLKVQANKQTNLHTHTHWHESHCCCCIMCIVHIIYNHKFITICLKFLFLLVWLVLCFLSFYTEESEILLFFFYLFVCLNSALNITVSLLQKPKTNKVYWLTFMVCVYVSFLFLFFFYSVLFCFCSLFMCFGIEFLLLSSLIVALFVSFVMCMSVCTCTWYVKCKTMQFNPHNNAKPQANKL